MRVKYELYNLVDNQSGILYANDENLETEANLQAPIHYLPEERHTMQTALKIQTTVTTEGKIEISMPELTLGKPVEVIILFPEPEAAEGEPASAPQLSALDILNRSPGQRQFKNSDEVEAYLHQVLSS